MCGQSCCSQCEGGRSGGCGRAAMGGRGGGCGEADGARTCCDGGGCGEADGARQCCDGARVRGGGRGADVLPWGGRGVAGRRTRTVGQCDFATSLPKGVCAVRLCKSVKWLGSKGVSAVGSMCGHSCCSKREGGRGGGMLTCCDGGGGVAGRRTGRGRAAMGGVAGRRTGRRGRAAMGGGEAEADGRTV